MATKRACLPCKNVDVESYLRNRMHQGVSVRTISAELANRDRMEAMGYKAPPGPTVLDTHLREHVKQTAPVSSTMPSFGGPEESSSEAPQGDVATVIQQKSLEMLAAGEMRLTATNALKAQDILDRRAEKSRDRQLLLVLARVLTKQSVPPSKYVGMAEGIEVIEGEVVEH